MIVAMLIGLVALTPTAAADVAAAPDAIVIMGARLKPLRIVTRKDRRTGVTRCIFKRRSGDPVLDAGVCAAVLGCVAMVQSAAEIRPCMAPMMARMVPKTPWRAQAAADAR